MTLPVLSCPQLESWSEMKSFATSLRRIGKYRVVADRIAGCEDLTDAILAYYRGVMHGWWMVEFSRRHKQMILVGYAALRLER